MAPDAGPWRDPAEADLNTLLARTRRAADLYAGLAGDAGPRLGTLFRELASSHRERAEELEADVRRLEALPMDPDPDAESLEQMLARARAALAGIAGHADRARAEDRLCGEDEIADALEAAAAHDLPESVQATLAKLRETVGLARTRLERYAAREE